YAEVSLRRPAEPAAGGLRRFAQGEEDGVALGDARRFGGWRGGVLGGDGAFCARCRRGTGGGARVIAAAAAGCEEEDERQAQGWGPEPRGGLDGRAHVDSGTHCTSHREDAHLSTGRRPN